jgi:hypothetical protein
VGLFLRFLDSSTIPARPLARIATILRIARPSPQFRRAGRVTLVIDYIINDD